jgi:predicted ATPase
LPVALRRIHANTTALRAPRAVIAAAVDGPGSRWLAPISDPALVPHRLAAVLSVQEAADRPQEQAVAAAMRNSQLLLVLDNCEHLLDACARSSTFCCVSVQASRS